MDLLVSVNSVCAATDGAARELRRAGLGGPLRSLSDTPPRPAQPCHWFTRPHTASGSRVDTDHLQLLPLQVTSPLQGTGPTTRWLLLRDTLHPSESNAVKLRTMIPTGRYARQEILSPVLRPDRDLRCHAQIGRQSPKMRVPQPFMEMPHLRILGETLTRIGHVQTGICTHQCRGGGASLLLHTQRLRTTATAAGYVNGEARVQTAASRFQLRVPATFHAASQV